MRCQDAHTLQTKETLTRSSWVRSARRRVYHGKRDFQNFARTPLFVFRLPISLTETTAPVRSPDQGRRTCVNARTRSHLTTVKESLRTDCYPIFHTVVGNGFCFRRSALSIIKATNHKLTRLYSCAKDKSSRGERRWFSLLYLLVMLSSISQTHGHNFIGKKSIARFKEKACF